MLNSASNNSGKYTTKIISDNQRHVIQFINYVILSGAISVWGTVANVINMVVFYKQGLDTTINISFFSLAVSDLFCMIFQQLLSLFVNPLFVNLCLPIAYLEFQYLTTALTREMFARITCLITAFITAERCLCVVFPLHIKQIITPRKTTIIIIVIFSGTLMSPVPTYCTYYYSWKFYPDTNQTLLGFAVTEHNQITEAFIYILHALFTGLGFLSVLIFTLILTYKLGQKSAWRQTANADQDKAKMMSKRDRATITMVVLIASILVVCYTPAVLLCLTTFIVPEFHVGGKFYNISDCLWSTAMLCENINSSVNIFLYYKMSSKYRQVCRELLSACLRRGRITDLARE